MFVLTLSVKVYARAKNVDFFRTLLFNFYVVILRSELHANLRARFDGLTSVELVKLFDASKNFLTDIWKKNNDINILEFKH